MILYHATPKSNLPSIEANGLQPTQVHRQNQGGVATHPVKDTLGNPAHDETAQNR